MPEHPSDVTEIHLQAVYKTRDGKEHTVTTPRFVLGEFPPTVHAIVLVGAYDILRELEAKQLLSKMDRPAAHVPNIDHGNMRSLPQYQSNKTGQKVWALRIKEVSCHADPDPNVTIEAFAKTDKFQGAHLFFSAPGWAPIPVDADWYRKHNPEKDGYYVVDASGNKSYTNGAAFEAEFKALK